MRHKIFVGRMLTGKTHTMQQMAAPMENGVVISGYIASGWPRQIMALTLENAFFIAPVEDKPITYFIDNLDLICREDYFGSLIEAIKNNEHIHLVAAGQSEQVVREALEPLLDECEFVFKTKDWE